MGTPNAGTAIPALGTCDFLPSLYRRSCCDLTLGLLARAWHFTRHRLARSLHGDNSTSPMGV